MDNFGHLHRPDLDIDHLGDGGRRSLDPHDPTHLYQRSAGHHAFGSAVILERHVDHHLVALSNFGEVEVEQRAVDRMKLGILDQGPNRPVQPGELEQGVHPQPGRPHELFQAPRVERQVGRLFLVPVQDGGYPPGRPQFAARPFFGGGTLFNFENLRVHLLQPFDSIPPCIVARRRGDARYSCPGRTSDPTTFAPARPSGTDGEWAQVACAIGVVNGDLRPALRRTG